MLPGSSWFQASTSSDCPARLRDAEILGLFSHNRPLCPLIQSMEELEEPMYGKWVLTNLNWRVFALNFVANAGLYLFYCLVPFSESLQNVNRIVFWRIF